MTEISPSEMKEAKRIPKTNFSFLLLEHLTETLDGIEIGKVLQWYANLRRIKVEEFTQHNVCQNVAFAENKWKKFICAGIAA